MKLYTNHLTIYLLFTLTMLGCSVNLSNSDKLYNSKEVSKKTITTPDAPKPIVPYSQAVYANGFLFISGQIAIDPVTGKLDSTDFASQTKKVMENLKAIFKASDMNFNNVIKTTIYITDMSKFAAINNIYSQYFKDNFPARETVQVNKLPKNASLEISMVAFK